MNDINFNSASGCSRFKETLKAAALFGCVGALTVASAAAVFASCSSSFFAPDSFSDGDVTSAGPLTTVNSHEIGLVAVNVMAAAGALFPLAAEAYVNRSNRATNLSIKNPSLDTSANALVEEDHLSHEPEKKMASLTGSQKSKIFDAPEKNLIADRISRHGEGHVSIHIDGIVSIDMYGNYIDDYRINNGLLSLANEYRDNPDILKRINHLRGLLDVENGESSSELEPELGFVEETGIIFPGDSDCIGHPELKFIDRAALRLVKESSIAVIDEFGFTELERDHILFFLKAHPKDIADLFSRDTGEGDRNWWQLGMGESKRVYKYSGMYEFYRTPAKNKFELRRSSKDEVWPPRFVVKVLGRGDSHWGGEESDLRREFNNAKIVREKIKEGGYQLLNIPNYLYLTTPHGEVLIASSAEGFKVAPDAAAIRQVQEELLQLKEETGLCDISIFERGSGMAIHNAVWKDSHINGQYALTLLDLDCMQPS